MVAVEESSPGSRRPEPGDTGGNVCEYMKSATRSRDHRGQRLAPLGDAPGVKVDPQVVDPVAGKPGYEADGQLSSCRPQVPGDRAADFRIVGSAPSNLSKGTENSNVWGAEQGSQRRPPPSNTEPPSAAIDRGKRHMSRRQATYCYMAC